MLFLPAKFGANRKYHFDVIQLLVEFSFSSAAIFDFEKFRFDASRCHAKKHEYNIDIVYGRLAFRNTMLVWLL